MLRPQTAVRGGGDSGSTRWPTFADTDNGVDDAAHGYEGEKPTGRRTERKDARNAQMPRVEPGG